MDIPNPRTVKDITKRGYLQKLAPRTFPYIPHPWKRKFCLLVKDRIYYYDKEESRASDKGTGVIALQYFDQISEASSKESKKANNVFIVATRDKRFSDQNRHLFSADSAEDMRDWLLLIKRAIENTRDTKSEAVLAKSAPSSPRAPSVISKDTKGANAEGEAGKVKKWRSGEEKENGANDINRVSDPSIRKKRSDPNSKTADGTHPKNELPESEGPPNSNCSSLGRKGRGKLIQSNPKVDFKYAPGDLEGMMFGSLGRQLKVDKAKTGSSQVSGGSNNSEHSESFGSVSMDSKKRKAEEQSNDDFLQTSSESSQKMERLESVTKNRVKGPPGRRMPQHRRGHLMKHRASSMSALAKDGKPEIGAEAEGNENAISFVPWLNRSLDLLEDQTAEEALGYIYSDMEDEPEEMFEYNIGFHEDAINEYNIDDVNMMAQNDTTDSFNSCSGAPPLPPRADANQERHYQLLKQFHQQHQYEQMQNPNQAMSPFGTVLQNQQNRKSFIANDALYTQNNELLISSPKDAENGEGNAYSNGKLLNSEKEDLNSKSSNIRNRQPKVPNRRLVCQPDISKFNIALKDLEKHVVQLDQAVNGITKEVELSKNDLGFVKSGFSALKKEKEKLTESFSVMSQEATKMKEQVSAALKDSERLQKSATLALVAAERSKSDQLSLKKEYELMILDLKGTIDRIKTEAAESLNAVAKANRLSVSSLVDEESEEDNSLNKDEERGRRKKSLKNMDRGRSSSKQRESDSKSSSYLEFFSRPSSLISNLTSFTRSSAEDQERFESSPKLDKKSSKQKPKDKTKGLKRNSKKNPQVTVEDIPMMDESLGTPMTMSPAASDHEQNDSEVVKITNLNHVKSSSESSRLNNMRSKSPKPELENLGSIDSLARPISPFNVGRYLIDGRANSPTRYLHRPGSTPGPMSRQGSMTTVPEDRAIDIRLNSENRPSDPPPPPPASQQQIKAGVFAISRQNSSPNIATQKSSSALPRQHSLGILCEDGKSGMSRQGSMLSVPDDRLIVDRTLTMSPSPSMMSFPGSWSTTSLNRQDSAFVEDTPRPEIEIRKHLPKDPLEQVAGRILAGSSLQSGRIAPYEEKNDEPPLATSSLKRRKKIKKDPNMN